MRLGACALLALATLGCDPVSILDGRVVRAPDSPADSRVYEDAVPIAGARVSTLCPGPAGHGPTPLWNPPTSDAHGRIDWQGMGWDWAAQCSLVVSADGYEDEVVPIKDLCPAGQDSCSRIAFQAELVPKAGTPLPPSTTPAPPRAPPVPIHFTSVRRDLTVLTLVAGGWGQLRAWEPVCRPPCDALLSPDAKLAVALGDHPPLEPAQPVALAPDARLDVGYEDRRSLGRVAGLIALGGIVSGIAMLVAGVPGDHQPWHSQNVVLVSVGGALVLGSGALLAGPASASDEAHVSP